MMPSFFSQTSEWATFAKHCHAAAQGVQPSIPLWLACRSNHWCSPPWWSNWCTIGQGASPRPTIDWSFPKRTQGTRIFTNDQDVGRSWGLGDRNQGMAYLPVGWKCQSRITARANWRIQQARQPKKTFPSFNTSWWSWYQLDSCWYGGDFRQRLGKWKSYWVDSSVLTSSCV